MAEEQILQMYLGCIGQRDFDTYKLHKPEVERTTDGVAWVINTEEFQLHGGELAALAKVFDVVDIMSQGYSLVLTVNPKLS